MDVAQGNGEADTSFDPELMLKMGQPLPYKFCVNRLRGFSVTAPPKVPFPILF